jgi:hypothetical protein
MLSPHPIVSAARESLTLSDDATPVCKSGILFTGITMLTSKYGVNLNDIPTDHPNAGKFKPLRPYEGKQYDLVFCDGQGLRTQKCRAYREAARRTNAQLTLGLQRIKPDDLDDTPT